MLKGKGSRINKVFVLVYFSFLFILLFYILLKPQTISSEIENRFLNTRGKIKETYFLDNSFQTTTNNIIADQFPKRELIVSFKKSLDYKTQLLFRKNDNKESLVLYSMEDGSRYQIGNSNYIRYNFMFEDETIKQRLIDRVEELNKLDKDFKDVDVYLYLPVQAHELGFFDEENNIHSYGESYDQIILNSAHIPNGHLIVNNFDEYKKMFYASDHHWNNIGSYQGYLDIIKLLKPNDEALIPIDTIGVDDGRLFYGTHGNATGRVLLGDYFEVYTFDFPKFKIFNYLNEEIIDDKNPNYFSKHYKEIEGDYFYNNAYSIYDGLSHFYNEKGEGNILVVGDSYMSAVSHLIASHYENAYFYNPANCSEKIIYDDFIETNNINDILYMTTIENYFYEDEWGERYKFFSILRRED